MEIVSFYIEKIFEYIILGLAAFAAYYAGKLAIRNLNTEAKQAVAKTVVRFVEQVYKDLHGEDKLMKAMEKAAELLSAKGIRVTSDELRVLLEAAVNEFNDTFHKVTDDEEITVVGFTDGQTETAPVPDYDPDDYSESGMF